MLTEMSGRFSCLFFSQFLSTQTDTHRTKVSFTINSPCSHKINPQPSIFSIHRHIIKKKKSEHSVEIISDSKSSTSCKKENSENFLIVSFVFLGNQTREKNKNHSPGDRAYTSGAWPKTWMNLDFKLPKRSWASSSCDPSPYTSFNDANVGTGVSSCLAIFSDFDFNSLNSIASIRFSSLFQPPKASLPFVLFSLF